LLKILLQFQVGSKMLSRVQRAQTKASTPDIDSIKVIGASHKKMVLGFQKARPPRSGFAARRGDGLAHGDKPRQRDAGISNPASAQDA
jgi:hypothetical protein